MARRILFVDDEESIRETLAVILKMHGFEVSKAATVAEALQKITSERFDVLLSDLNIGGPGDGLTVVSAMRRTQPDAVTMILTGYPALETALEAIRQQVDDYIIKPAQIPALLDAIESKLATPRASRRLPPPKRVAMILRENVDRVEGLWFSWREEDASLAKANSSPEEALAYVHEILQDVIRAAEPRPEEKVGEHKPFVAAHAARRELDGYTPGMVLTEVCLLRRAVAQIVQENLLEVNLSYLITDIAQINEALDGQAKSALATLSEHSDDSTKLSR